MGVLPPVPAAKRWLSEELLNLLAKIPELRVPARTSSFAFKGQNLEIPEIAERLNVAHILEGSVRRSGDRVRIAAQLIRAKDGFQLWSQEWDRTFDDIFVIQGGIAQDYDNDLAAAARHFERALELEPGNLEIISEAAVLARYLGRLGEAIVMLEYTLARDPLSATAHYRVGLNYLWAGRPDDAIVSLRGALSLSPGFLGAQYNIGTALLMKGEPQAALGAFQQEEEDEEYRLKGTAMALFALGRQAEHEAALKELKTGWGEQWPSEVAQVYAWIGNADAAFEWLNRAVAQNEDGLIEQFPQPFYAPLQDDPRWQAFRRKTGTSEAQLAAIEFRVKLPE